MRSSDQIPVGAVTDLIKNNIEYFDTPDQEFLNAVEQVSIGDLSRVLAMLMPSNPEKIKMFMTDFVDPNKDLAKNIGEFDKTGGVATLHAMAKLMDNLTKCSDIDDAHRGVAREFAADFRKRVGLIDSAAGYEAMLATAEHKMSTATHALRLDES